MLYPTVQQRRFWPCNETHMKLQSADVPQQALNSLCQFCKSVFFVVSLLEASPVHETLWDTKRGSPKVWKSDISCLWLSYKMTREHFIFELEKWQVLESFLFKNALMSKVKLLLYSMKRSNQVIFNGKRSISYGTPCTRVEKSEEFSDLRFKKLAFRQWNCEKSLKFLDFQ